MTRSRARCIVYGAVLAFSCLAVAAQAPLPSSVVTLEGEGASYRGRLVSDAPARFRVAVREGDFLSLVVDQQGVDVSLKLFDPTGTIVGDCDRPNGQTGPERVEVVALRGGDYQLEVVPSGTGRGAGEYVATVAALRRPTPRDVIEADAAAAFTAARIGAGTNTGESRERVAQAYLRSAQLFESLDEHYEEVMSLYNAAFTRMVSSQPRLALDILPRALNLTSELQVPRLEASVLNLIGGAHDILGNLDVAMQHYQRALALMRGLQINAASMLNNIGKLHHDMADFQRSLQYYSEAADGAAQSKSVRVQGIAVHNMGVTYADLGELDLAMDHYERALALRRAGGDKAGEADTLTSQAEIHLMRGDAQRALEVYGQAMVLRTAVGDRRTEATTMAGMAEAQAQLGHLDQARTLHEQALALRRASGDRRNEAKALLSLARLSRDEPARTAELAQQSIVLYRQLDDRQGIADGLTELAHAKRDLGRLEEAARDLGEALDTTEQVRARVDATGVRASYFSRRREAYFLAIDVYARLDRARPGQGYAARGLETSERARARSLLELLNAGSTRVTRGGDPALLERERAVTQGINAKGDRLLRLPAGASADREALERELRALESEHDELRAQIRRASPAYAALTDARPASAAEIQQQLDDDTTLIEYAIGETESYAWIVSRNRVDVYTLPAAAAIAEAVTAVRERLAVRPAAGASPVPLQQAVRRLSDLVIKPLEGALTGSRIAVVADGPLEYVPFGLLARSTPAAPPLIAQAEIIALPSASALALVRDQATRRAAPTRGVAVLADPVFDVADLKRPAAGTTRAVDPAGESRLLVHTNAGGALVGDRIPALPFTRVEAASIARAAAGLENLQAIGVEATRELMLGGRLRPYRYVHVATHGLVDVERPSLSSIVMSTVDAKGQPRDGFVRAHEIYNLELLADLVVLSACETGLGREVKGEGLIGLTRGFMYAGAPRVVVSLWSVSDRATASLMGAFYEDMLKRGKTPAAALRAAQLTVRADPRWSHPYYWAAFVLNGEWR